uniref:Uncharacterized protein n=1 Tax=Salix viminalis TaxID=40686 RepID=A0A6N2KKN4_SALVM
MGNDRCNIPCKPRYDITMSRRTRKPVMSVEEAGQNPTTVLISPDEEIDAKDGVVHDKETESFPAKVGVEEDRKSSLEQLIISNSGDRESDEPAKRAVQETRVEDDENIESRIIRKQEFPWPAFQGRRKAASVSNNETSKRRN